VARTLPGTPPTWFDEGVVGSAIRLRFTLADQDGARQMVRASLPDVHGEALLLCGGERARACRLTEETFAWLSREVRRGRETVTLGRLQLVLRHHFLEELDPAGRRRRRARAAARALEATRAVIGRGPADDVSAFVRDLPQLARAVVVLRHVDRMLLPDVAAALRMPEGTVAEIEALVRDALGPVGGVPALRGALSMDPPPIALTGRVLAPLIDAVSPSYLVAPASSVPLFVGDEIDRSGDAGARRGGRAFGTAPVRRVPGLVVALLILAALAGITAGRQLLGTDRRPAPPPPATTVPAPVTMPLPAPEAQLPPASVSAPTPSPFVGPAGSAPAAKCSEPEPESVSRQETAPGPLSRQPRGACPAP
jgi:DNA-directed RNA polymerase specialized sigma24 family protein